ncbi:MAG: helix-turn-helix domain-containing protein [Zoogloeaceae bacterium]|nr:helix-turn-helix domain-containing protein [Zoogloeaceae bacterium]
MRKIMKRTPVTEKNVERSFLLDEKNVAENIRSIIGDDGIRSFSRKCGIGHGQISEYLNGKRPPGLRHALAIARAAGVSLDWLATGREFTATPVTARLPADHPPLAAAAETPPPLTPEEQALLAQYRALPAADRPRALALLKALTP